MKKIALLFVFAVVLTGCTANQRAKKFGGTMRVEVPPHRKLVTVTWKDENLWVLTRERKPGEKPEVYSFREESSFGLIEGEVEIVEKP